MSPHHKAWLDAHPERSRDWFDEAIANGFEVHHADGNHENNDPKNLVLIENFDHSVVHATPGFVKKKATPGPWLKLVPSKEPCTGPFMCRCGRIFQKRNGLGTHAKHCIGILAGGRWLFQEALKP